MNDEQTFLAAIRAGDDVARLAYADWLEERGDPRAEWVRDRLLFRWMPHGTDDPLPALLEAMPYRHHDADFALALQRLGPRVAPALWDRLLNTDDNDRRDEIAWCLSKMPVEAIRPHKLQLLDWLHSDNIRDRKIALTILPVVGAELPEALPRLRTLLLGHSEKNSSVDVDPILKIITLIGPPSLEIADVLIDWLPSISINSDFFDKALNAMGPGVLRPLVQSSPTWNEIALCHVTKIAEAFDLPTLEQFGVFDHPDPLVRTPFVLGCLARQPSLLAQLPELVETLRPHRNLLQLLSQSLQALGEQATPALPVLRQLQDAAPFELGGLLHALDPDHLRHTALSRLGDPDPSLRYQAIYSLHHHLRQFDPDTIDRIEALLEDEDPTVLHAALQYLRERPLRDEPRFSRRLGQLLLSGRIDIRNNFEYFSSSAPLPSLVETIMKLLDSDQVSHQRTACHCLRWDLGLDPESFAPILLRCLERPSILPWDIARILEEHPETAECLWPDLAQRLYSAPLEDALRWTPLLRYMPETLERTEATLHLLHRAHDTTIPFAHLDADAFSLVLHEAAWSEATLDFGEPLTDWLWDWCHQRREWNSLPFILARHTRSGPDKLATLFDDELSYIALRAIRSLKLAPHLSPDVLVALRERLFHPDTEYREAALFALGSRATREDLLPLIEDPNHEVRELIFEHLQTRGDDPRIWPHLLTLADDDTPGLRREITRQARHHLPPEDARAWLLSRLERETELDVRDTIRTELSYIEITEPEAQS